MTKQQLKSSLKDTKGYFHKNKLKKGYKWLSNRYNVTESLVRQAVSELREEYYNNLDVKIDDSDLLDSLETKEYSFNSSNSITRDGTYLVLGCVHAPFQNKAMIDSVFKFIDSEIKIAGIILNGDIIDNHSLSRYNRGKVTIPGINLQWEYDQANKFMDQVDSLLRSSGEVNPQKHYLFGNHERTYFKAISEFDASKYGEALKSPSEALKLDQRGYRVQSVYEEAYLMLGHNLEVNHGEFYNVHCAKKTIDVYKHSVLFNHTHRFQIYSEGKTVGWNMGWAGDVNSPAFNYASRSMKNSWVNACALVTLDAYSDHYVQPLIFKNDKLIVNNKIY